MEKALNSEKKSGKIVYATDKKVLEILQRNLKKDKSLLSKLASM